MDSTLGIDMSYVKKSPLGDAFQLGGVQCEETQEGSPSRKLRGPGWPF